SKFEVIDEDSDIIGTVVWLYLDDGTSIPYLTDGKVFYCLDVIKDLKYLGEFPPSSKVEEVNEPNKETHSDESGCNVEIDATFTVKIGDNVLVLTKEQFYNLKDEMEKW